MSYSEHVITKWYFGLFSPSVPLRVWNEPLQVYFDLSMYEESLADFEASMEEDRAGDEESETYYETRAQPATYLLCRGIRSKMSQISRQCFERNVA
jgi:hypothetical protein